MSVIHESLDTHKDREVRRALDPLARFCSETGVTTLGLVHVNKSNDTDPLNLIMGSRAFAAVARSVLYCMADPEAEQDDRYLLGHVKSNLGPKQQTLVYGIEQVKIQLDDAEQSLVLTSRVKWGGADARSIREAMETPRPDRAVGELATRIEEWVAEQGRTVPASELSDTFSDVKPATLKSCLTRMVQRGTLNRPLHGHYAIGQRLHPVSGDFLSATIATSATSVADVAEVAVVRARPLGATSPDEGVTP